jgi:quercetin dioxygenase-like cupin family protein
MFSILDPRFFGSQHDLSATPKSGITNDVSVHLVSAIPGEQAQTDLLGNHIRREKMKILLGTIAIGMMLCCSFAQKATAQHDPAHAVFLKFSNLKWEKTPDGLQDIAILHVNPVSKASELIIRAPKNFHVPRHWHSANETITIISGTFTMKHDGTDEKVMLDKGSYSYMPANMIHEAWAGDEGATFLVTVDGPWDLHFVE